MSAEPLAGKSAVPGLYVRFEDGLATVDDPELIKLMMNHAAYGSDFTKIAEEEEAIWNAKPVNSEPEHSMMNIEYGHPGKEQNPKGPVPLNPELQKYITDLATKIALQIIKEKDKKDKAPKAPAKTAKAVAAETTTTQDDQPPKQV